MNDILTSATPFRDLMQSQERQRRRKRLLRDALDAGFVLAAFAVLWMAGRMVL